MKQALFSDELIQVSHTFYSKNKYARIQKLLGEKENVFQKLHIAIWLEKDVAKSFYISQYLGQFSLKTRTHTQWSLY